MRLFLVILFSLVIHLSYAQDETAPTYLTEQDFPDSVLNLSIHKLDGTTTSFKEIVDTHKGKKVVMEFWASWCKDCIDGLPKLTDLMHHTRKHDVSYIFISLDKDDKKWHSSVKQYHIKGKGDHYRIASGWKNKLTDYVGLDWIPRYIVLDTNGKVLMPKAISADDKKLKECVHK